jgi:hypothetical protein
MNLSMMVPILSDRWRRWLGTALILMAAALATGPEYLRGASCGHDFDFHLVSWFDALHSWSQGIVYPHWTPSPNFGAGEPRFIFYPPLTWMLGAAMGMVLPWHAVPGVMTFLLLAATGLATRALSRMAYPEGPSMLAGCVAIFSGYALFTAYERSAFAEMTGGFWIPLMMLLVLRERQPERGAAGRTQASMAWRVFDGSTVPLALVVAGAWLSNAPVGVMLCYLMAAFALAVAALSRSWVPVLRAATAAALGLGLAAFYLVPAAWEQRWVEIRQATDDPGLLIENSWLFARHANPQLELHDVELIRVSFIVVTMVAVALGGFVVNWLRKTLPPQRRWWVPLAIIPVVIFFLQLPVSLPVWNVLPKLRFLQFPWRWLVALEAPMAIFFASAIWMSHRWRRFAVLAACLAGFVVAAALAGVSLFQGCDSEDAVRGMVADYQSGAGFEGTDEYAPPGADNTLVATGLPAACLVTDPATVLGQGDPDMTPEWSADQGTCDATFPFASGDVKATAQHLHIHADIPHPGYLILRLRSYPAWDVRLNGRPAPSSLPRQDGLMAVPVPQGSVDLTADWTTTADVVAGRCVSAAALLLVTLLGLLEYRRFRPRLS